MKEKDFSGADLPLFSLEASVQLAFLTLIEAKKSSRELHLILFLSSIQPQTPLFTQPTKFYPSKQRTLASIRDPKTKLEESSGYVNGYLTIIYYKTDWRTINP